MFDLLVKLKLKLNVIRQWIGWIVTPPLSSMLPRERSGLPCWETVRPARSNPPLEWLSLLIYLSHSCVLYLLIFLLQFQLLVYVTSSNHLTKAAIDGRFAFTVTFSFSRSLFALLDLNLFGVDFSASLSGPAWFVRCLLWWEDAELVPQVRHPGWFDQLHQRSRLGQGCGFKLWLPCFTGARARRGRCAVPPPLSCLVSHNHSVSGICHLFPTLQGLSPGDSVEVRYTGWLNQGGVQGKSFDTNMKAEKAFRFKLGKGKVIRGGPPILFGTLRQMFMVDCFWNWFDSESRLGWGTRWNEERRQKVLGRSFIAGLRLQGLWERCAT